MTSKVSGGGNSVDKFYALLQARIKFINEVITFTGQSNITINLNVWGDIFKTNCVDILTHNIIGDIEVGLNYPEHFYHVNYEDVVIDSITNIQYRGKKLELAGLSLEDKYKILHKLPPNLIEHVKQYVLSNIDNKLILMTSKLGIPELSVNFFDNSAYTIVKILYQYYSCDEILDLVFMLSRGVPDVGYINTRTPRELDYLIKLYSQDVDKVNRETKLHI